LLSRFVLEHRLSTKDPLAPADDAWERDAIALVLGDEAVPLARAAALLVA
jgi:hypothetical protein